MKEEAVLPRECCIGLYRCLGQKVGKCIRPLSMKPLRSRFISSGLRDGRLSAAKERWRGHRTLHVRFITASVLKGRLVYCHLQGCCLAHNGVSNRKSGKCSCFVVDFSANGHLVVHVRNTGEGRCSPSALRTGRA